MSTPTSPARTGAGAARADAVAAAVRACPAVADLHSGGLRQVATYLPGRRVAGVRVDGEGPVEVAVVAAWGVPAAVVAGQVRAAVAPLVGGRPVDVLVADVRLPAEEAASAAAGPAALPSGPA
ncbi:hypothetical protein [Quadrisphaera sp. DSM 44207]|uniref:hypothetical protein n=1 Tax=Quadrisphaera sp. DSM 44207 TaxID=1881057 RepID=UPI00089031A6|nr:hypothetical protein [Quadrisphaera sp. DSM 44207]SDQ85650.1 hypothetical protein SAMN05428996_2912 [Quadrisphaera sp. DSM 44207]